MLSLRTVANAPFWTACPAGYDGCAGDPPLVAFTVESSNMEHIKFKLFLKQGKCYTGIALRSDFIYGINRTMSVPLENMKNHYTYWRIQWLMKSPTHSVSNSSAELMSTLKIAANPTVSVTRRNDAHFIVY